MHVVCTGITGDVFHNKIVAKQDIFVCSIVGTVRSLHVNEMADLWYEKL